jgi:Fe-S cluster biogenesis protein NfuA
MAQPKSDRSREHLVQRVRQALDEQIRPALQASGGELELLGVDGGVVKVRFLGSCRGCPSTAMTILMNMERQLRAIVPGVEYLEVSP